MPVIRHSSLSTSTLVVVMILCFGVTGAQPVPAKAPGEDPRVERILSQLTLDEKLSLLGGTGFETKPIPRLGVPPLNMTDGPVGVRWKKSTAFPVSIMMAASWNPTLIENVGGALGREAKAKGRRMLLAPCVNIHRTPFGGRNFESFGEDPYLAARMAVAYVKGVQSEKVVATTKHFACNNQEFERDFTNVTVDERTLREIYLPAFEAAVTEAGSMSVMSAYNKVNGAWCSENPHLLLDILKGDWGFKGFVVSDWGAVHSSVPTALAGLDVEMPDGKYLNAESLMPAIRSGEVREDVINDKVRRLLRMMAWVGLLDKGPQESGAVDTPEHRALALRVAEEGLVLLKNEGDILPLDAKKIKTLAVIGPNAAVAQTGGGGSSRVDPVSAVSTLQGVLNRLGPSVKVVHVMGCRPTGDINPLPPEALVPPAPAAQGRGWKGEYFSNRDLRGDPALTRIDLQVNFDWGDEAPAPGLPEDNFSVRWTGSLVAPKTGRYVLKVVSDDGCRFFFDGRLVVDNWSDHAPEMNEFTVNLEAGIPHSVKIEYYEHSGGAVMRCGWTDQGGGQISEAVKAAREADAVVLCVGLSDHDESEGFDRKSLALPDEQVDLINAVVAANRKSIVVLNSGAPVLMGDWLPKVPALLEVWFPGEEGGTAVAKAIFGDINPSGKLPMTFLRRWEDSPAYGNYPGSGAVRYTEGIFVGYRSFDQRNVDVQYPFGYGLSYTSFAYSNLLIRREGRTGQLRVTVSVSVRNTGSRAGAEVVELYVHDPTTAVSRPPKELKGIQKVTLEPGEAQTVTFTLNERSFAYYDTGRKGWRVDTGAFEIQVGSSSRDIRLRGTYTHDR